MGEDGREIPFGRTGRCRSRYTGTIDLFTKSSREPMFEKIQQAALRRGSFFPLEFDPV